MLGARLVEAVAGERGERLEARGDVRDRLRRRRLRLHASRQRLGERLPVERRERVRQDAVGEAAEPCRDVGHGRAELRDDRSRAVEPGARTRAGRRRHRARDVGDEDHLRRGAGGALRRRRDGGLGDRDPEHETGDGRQRGGPSGASSGNGLEAERPRHAPLAPEREGDDGDRHERQQAREQAVRREERDRGEHQ